MDRSDASPKWERRRRLSRYGNTSAHMASRTHRPSPIETQATRNGPPGARFSRLACCCSPIATKPRPSADGAAGQALHQLVDDPPERLEGVLDSFDRALAQPEARAFRRIGGGDPATVDFTQPHVDPERRTAEPKNDHGEGIADAPCGPPCGAATPRSRAPRSTERRRRDPGPTGRTPSPVAPPR